MAGFTWGSGSSYLLFWSAALLGAWLQSGTGEYAGTAPPRPVRMPLLGTEAVMRKGVRSELVHRDALEAASKRGKALTLWKRIREAVRRSRARAEKLGQKVRAFSIINNTSAAISQTLFSLTVPVSSDQGEGEYLMKLQLGSPAQSFHAIVDTGSDLIWVQCLPCTSCYQSNDPKFDPSKSSTYSLLTCNSQTCLALNGNRVCGGSNCNYIYQYEDGSSTQGDFSTETLTMSTTTGGRVALKPLAFGCGHQNEGTFSPNTGGLVGLGRGPVSLVSQLSSVIEEQFSYCLVDFGDASTLTSPLFFGSAANLSGSDIITTPILNAQVPTFYYVLITEIDVGGTDVKIPSRSFDSSSAGTVFDSGTTLTYFHSAAYSKVKSAFASHISLPRIDGSSIGLDLCYNIASEPNFRPPTLTIHFTNVILSPPPANYFILGAANTLCLAILNAGTPGNPSIIGGIMQQNYHVKFDLVSSQISLQPATCDHL